MADTAFKHVAIIGVGLLGGSLGLALRRRGMAGRIVGVARRLATRDIAVKRGCVDHATDDLAEACDGADLVVIATPVMTGLMLLEPVAQCSGAAWVTDVGSTKASTVAAAEALEALAPRFVGAHPMAGSEATGPGAAEADLFEGKPVVLTPGPGAHADAVDRVEQLWAAVGMTVYRMDPHAHDRAVARVSHLPHLLSVLLMNHVGDDEPAMRIASTGLADTTRLAGGDVTMWADILIDNAAEAIDAIEEYRDDLTDLRDALMRADRAKIEAVLTTAQQRRLAWRGPGEADE